VAVGALTRDQNENAQHASLADLAIWLPIGFGC